MIKTGNQPIMFIILLLTCIFASGCVSLRQFSGSSSIPVLSQDELIRPYTKLGRIQVTREFYGTDLSLSPDVKAWGLAAVRQEAEKMGADAIMLHEVTSHSETFALIPSTEYRATGFAIKFK